MSSCVPLASILSSLRKHRAFIWQPMLESNQLTYFQRVVSDTVDLPAQDAVKDCCRGKSFILNPRKKMQLSKTYTCNCAFGNSLQLLI